MAFQVPRTVRLACKIGRANVKYCERFPLAFTTSFHTLGNSQITIESKGKAAQKLKSTVHSNYHLRSFNSETKNVSESTILVQQDFEIQELPVIVLKSDPTQGNGTGSSVSKERPRPYVVLDPTEEAAFIEAFKSYHTPQELLRILETIPPQEVTPVVAYTILKKLFELESNFGFRNNGRSWIVASGNGAVETFTRAAIINRLLTTVMCSDDTKLMLDTLDLLRNEKHLQGQDIDELLNYTAKLCDFILVKATEGKLTLEEACRAVCSFGEIAKFNNFTTIDKSFIDKMWVGIIDKGAELTVNNIVQVFKTVSYFEKSQRLVFKLVEKYLTTFWWRMDSDTVAQLCDIIGSNDPTKDSWGWGMSSKILKTLARCTSFNIHQVTEDQLLRILRCFSGQNFSDPVIQSALSKYMKAKRDKITKPEVVTLVVDYVKKYRFRSLDVLESVADFVVKTGGKNLSPPQITSIVTGFGYLNYQPADRPKFWNIIEEILDDKFIQFAPRDMVNVLLACVYLKKHPLNFISRIFSPYFLDRIHSSESEFSKLQAVRNNLKLLDAALNLECGWKYGGPFLPKDFSAYSIAFDGRLQRAVDIIAKPIEKIYENENFCSVEPSVLLPSLPLNELYFVDILLVPMKGSESQLYNFIRNRISAREVIKNEGVNFTAVLVHIPDHYTMDGHLIGPQEMRVRHLDTLGLRVVNIKYDEIMVLASKPTKLTAYLTNILANKDDASLL